MTDAIMEDTERNTSICEREDMNQPDLKHLEKS